MPYRPGKDLISQAELRKGAEFMTEPHRRFGWSENHIWMSPRPPTRV